MDKRTKKIIEETKDPELLRALLNDAINHIEHQRQIIEKIEAENLSKSQASFVLEERVKLFIREKFGKKSEKRLEASDRPRDKSQEEALLFSQAAFPAPVARDEAKGKLKGRDLEEVIVDQYPSKEQLFEEARVRGINANASDWSDTGLFDESIKIQIIERKYVRERHRRHKLKLRAELSGEKDVIVTADSCPELLAGMNYTTEFVASVVADKYISHLPLERQTREMESLGLLGMKNSTLSRLSSLAAASLEPLAEKIRREDLLPSDLALHLDETPWKIQNKNEKNGYMWVISNRFGSYYFYRPTRSATVVTEKLEGYQGPVVTDGYKSYDDVLGTAKIPHAYCWAHARREFLPLEDHDPTVKPILDLIDKLFEIEREAKDFDGLRLLRKEMSGSTCEELHALLLSELPRSRPGSQKKKAIEYSLKRWIGLTMFLTDIKIPLSNNEAERTIRHAVMGRKNYYGSGNHVGAATAATLFTIIESAKKNDLDPRSFLAMSLERLARGEDLETPLAFARRTRSSGQPA